MLVKKNKSGFVGMVFLFSTILILGGVLSCEKANISPMNTQSAEKAIPKPNGDDYIDFRNICSEMTMKAILLENRQKIGFVYLYNDPKYLYVHLISESEFYFQSAYLYTGPERSIPMTEDGDLDFSRFTHVISSSELSKVRRFKVPLEQLQGKFRVSLMVEAQIPLEGGGFVRPMRAWAEGHFLGANVPGTYFDYIKGICYTQQADRLEEFEVQ